LPINPNGKRQVVVVMRERDGRNLTQVFKSKQQSTTFIRLRDTERTDPMAEGTNSWNSLDATIPIKRINQEAYGEDGTCTNDAENCFSQLGLAELDHHHLISG
jgi:hypothetical protein